VHQQEAINTTVPLLNNSSLNSKGYTYIFVVEEHDENSEKIVKLKIKDMATTIIGSE